VLDGLILFRKGDFVPKYVSRVVFKDGILGGARQFRGNPYLNSTTVLFDNFYNNEITRLSACILF